MELLIPGLILVALMVYASTRIKRSAAQAFEPETIDTDVFFFEKPEGFLTVLNGDPKLMYEGYSREFGGEGAEDTRQGRVEVRKIENETIKSAMAKIGEIAKITSKTTEVIDERKYQLVEAERVDKGIGMVELYKLTESGRDVIELKITAMQETNEDVARKISGIASSYYVK